MKGPQSVDRTAPDAIDSLVRPLIKICGITRQQDAETAATLGADALGFVFWARSPRAVTAETARAIVREMPAFVAAVGVFVNESPEVVLEVAEKVPLTVVQFHGDEADDEVIAFPWRVLRAVSLETPAGEQRLAHLPHRVTVLLDAHDPQRRGGTGRPVDWPAAARVAATRRVLLAGGLTPENVGEAIRQVRPWGVDVSSGVETAAGIKDAAKMNAFFQAVHDAASPGVLARPGIHPSKQK